MEERVPQRATGEGGGLGHMQRQRQAEHRAGRRPGECGIRAPMENADKSSEC